MPYNNIILSHSYGLIQHVKKKNKVIDSKKIKLIHFKLPTVEISLNLNIKKEKQLLVIKKTRIRYKLIYCSVFGVSFIPSTLVVPSSSLDVATFSSTVVDKAEWNDNSDLSTLTSCAV